jgi:hypothetical protein
LTQDEILRELRQRMRDPAVPLAERQLIQRMFVIRRGHQRYSEERVGRLPLAQLLNNWAACAPDCPGRLLDLSHLPDRQLIRAVFKQDIGITAEKAILADSAITELTKRANDVRLTVADYMKRTVRHIGSSKAAG